MHAYNYLNLMFRSRTTAMSTLNYQVQYQSQQACCSGYSGTPPTCDRECIS